jgi:hypothetical protein
MHIEVCGHRVVDRLQELLELDRTMAGVQRADHLAAWMSSAAYKLDVPERL